MSGVPKDRKIAQISEMCVPLLCKPFTLSDYFMRLVF